MSSFITPDNDPSATGAHLSTGVTGGAFSTSAGSVMNIYISEFDASISPAAATFESNKDTVPDCDYYAVYNVGLEEMRNAFQFNTDNVHFSNVTEDNLEFMTAWHPEWKFNAANAMMDDPNSSTSGTYISGDLVGSSIPIMPNVGAPNRATNLVVTHYLKYVSHILFGTAYGVDLIDNAGDIAQAFITSAETQWESNFANYIQGTPTAPFYCYNNNGSTGDTGIGATGIANSTQLAHLLFNALLTDPARFGDVSTRSNNSWISFPFMEGDSINFVCTVVPPTKLGGGSANVNLTDNSITDNQLKYCISLIINTSLANLNTTPKYGSDLSVYVAPIDVSFSTAVDVAASSAAGLALDTAMEQMVTDPSPANRVAVAQARVALNTEMKLNVTADNAELVAALAAAAL